MIRNRVLSLLLVAAFVALAFSGCAPVPGKVVMVGDSTAWLANYHGADWRGAEVNFDLGARANNEPHYHQAWVEAAVNDPARSPQVLAMVYGHNYVRSGVSQADQQELGRMVHAVMDNTGCVVLVLPAYAGTSANQQAMIDRYRAWAIAVANKYPQGVVLVDWQPVVDAHPEDWVGTDGIHMNDQASGVPYSEAVNIGVDACFALVS